MPTNLYDEFDIAGKEVSSTYEGRHVTFPESYLVHPSHTDGLVDGKDPVLAGNIVGVALKGAAANTDQIAIDTEGIWALTVVATDQLGNSAVAVGDEIYINRITAVLSKNSDLESNIPFGVALMSASSGVTDVIAVKVHNDSPIAQFDESYIVVSKGGNDTYGDGSFESPFLTFTKAFTMLSATRKTIYGFPGEYIEAAPLVWPNINGVQIVGLEGQGNVVISESSAGTEVIDITPTFTSASMEAFLENICVKHTAQIGIEIDNTNMTKKLLVHLKSVSTEQVSTGDSISIDNLASGNAIRVYMEGCREIEGLVHFTAANASDKFRAYDSVLAGGLTTAGAVTLEVMLQAVIVLAGALTIGDATALLTYRGCLYRTDADPSVYSELADGYQA
jgi:hypothetical protein